MAGNTEYTNVILFLCMEAKFHLVSEETYGSRRVCIACHVQSPREACYYKLSLKTTLKYEKPKNLNYLYNELQEIFL
jgi:hypothetical protein